MARKAAKHAANVNAVLLACERSRVLFSLDHQQQQDQTSSMPKQRKEVPAVDDSEVYEVEDILDDRIDPKTGEKMYLIKWQGYSEEENSWEVKSNLNCPIVLNRYHSRIAYAKKRKKLQDSKNKLHRKKPSAHKDKHKKIFKKVTTHLLYKQTVNKSHKGGRKVAQPKGSTTPLKVKIPLKSLKPHSGEASTETPSGEQNLLIQCNNVTSSPFSQINCDFIVDSSSCDESFLQGEGYTFKTSVEKLLLPWETTSADVPVSVDFCDYKDFDTIDPGETLINHYPTTPSIVSIEEADSSSIVSVGSPGNFYLALSPSQSLSSVTSHTTTSDIEVVDDITDLTPIINNNDLLSATSHKSPPCVVNPAKEHNYSSSPHVTDSAPIIGNKDLQFITSHKSLDITPHCVVNPVHVGKEHNHSSSPRFRMTMQRVQRNMSANYSILTEASVNGLNHSLNVNTVDHQLEQPYALRARDYQQELREWSASLNSKCKEKEAPILVENKYDEFPIPKDFEYVCTNLYGKGVPNPAEHEPVTYCKCQKCGIGNSGCCPAQLEALFPYYANGRVRVSPGKPIYECNSACICGPECCNRVVQKLRSIPLCIFRTGDAKGWGVKAVTEIKKNSFVCEYTGEVIMSDEAEQRGEVANAKGLTYIFDLDFHSEDDGCCFSIDASKYGNISHFFNHSCDPNLTVYSVWVDFIDPRLPRIAFFAKRHIHEGEELTFDYQITYSSSHYQQFSRVKCLCGSKNCQKYFM